MGDTPPPASTITLLETTKQSLDLAIAHAKPGIGFKEFGDIIEKHAKSKGLGVVKTYCGHGVNSLFHCAPNVPHYAKNKAVGKLRPGMTFTIEPMITIGNWKDRTWPDDWTSVTVDGSLSAQFEHTLLVTETGVEVLTARNADSPAFDASKWEATNGEVNGETNGEVKKE